MWPKWYSPPFKRRIADIVNAAARVSGFTPDQIKGPQRNQDIVRARFIVCAIAHKDGHSYPHIGRHIGNRDHTTIMSAVRKAEIYKQYDPDFVELFHRVALETARRAA